MKPSDRDDELAAPSLRSEVEAIFNRVLEPLCGTGGGPAAWLPQVDVREEPGKLVLEMDLPGVRREDLDIRVEGSQLTITGIRRARRKEIGERYHYEERYTGSFRRTLRLPREIDAGRITAILQEGILRLELPKKPGKGGER